MNVPTHFLSAALYLFAGIGRGNNRAFDGRGRLQTFRPEDALYCLRCPLVLNIHNGCFTRNGRYAHIEPKVDIRYRIPSVPKRNAACDEVSSVSEVVGEGLL